MNEAGTHTSPVLVARWLAGKASPDEACALEAHAAACAACGAALEDARAAQRDFSARVLPRTLPAIQRRAAASAGSRLARRWSPARVEVRARWRWPALAAGLACAAAVLAVTAGPWRARPGREAPARTSETVLQVKGGGVLRAFARRGGAVFPVADGAALRAGDQVRFGVLPGPARYVLVASVDGRGRVSVYHPSTAVTPGAVALQLLPDSVVLDDAPGPERIFAFFSASPIPAADLTAALDAVGQGGAPAIRGVTRVPVPFQQASLLVEKSP